MDESLPRRDELCVSVVEAFLRLDSDVPAASLRLKAGTMMVANHILRMAGRTWGLPVVADPRAHERHAMVAVHAMVSGWSKAQEVMLWTGRGEANLRQCMALDVCTVTLGVGLSQGAMPRVSSVWRDLWAARGLLSEALVSMREWEAERGVSALPRNDDGDYPDDMQALAYANVFPEYLRAKRR